MIGSLNVGCAAAQGTTVLVDDGRYKAEEAGLRLGVSVGEEDVVDGYHEVLEGKEPNDDGAAEGNELSFEEDDLNDSSDRSAAATTGVVKVSGANKNNKVVDLRKQRFMVVLVGVSVS